MPDGRRFISISLEFLRPHFRQTRSTTKRRSAAKFGFENVITHLQGTYWCWGATNDGQWLRARFSLAAVKKVKAAATDGEFYIAVFAGPTTRKHTRLSISTSRNSRWIDAAPPLYRVSKTSSFYEECLGYGLIANTPLLSAPSATVS